MEVFHFKDLGDAKVSSTNAVLVFNLVIYVASDTSPQYTI